MGRSAFSAQISAFVAISLWTSFILITRASAGGSLAPLDITLMRIACASIVLLPWSWILVRRRRAAATGSQASVGRFAGLSPLPLRTTAYLGIFGGVLYSVFAYAGFFYAPATHAAVLMPGSLPLWTALLAVFILKYRITPLRAAGLALIVAGDLLVGGKSLLAGVAGADVWKGDVLFMTAAACWAAYSVLARRFAVDAVHATMALTAFALVVYVPI